MPHVILLPGRVVPPELIPAHLPLTPQTMRGLTQSSGQRNGSVAEVKGRGGRVVRSVHYDVQIVESAHPSLASPTETTVIPDIGSKHDG